jgi:hypothetical protein
MNLNGKTVTRNILLVWLFLLTVTQPVQAEEDTADSEYQIKVAFLYNFLKFVDWPESKATDPNKPIIVGIIGQDVFHDAFDNTKNRTIEGRKVIINKFKGIVELQKTDSIKDSGQHPDIEAIRKSHLLFICPSEKDYITKILKSVEGNSILTVADTQGFLEAGGIINLVMEENKVRFEINMAAAKKAKIQIRSQLLRLAKKVI